MQRYGTAGYEKDLDTLVHKLEALPFEALHREVLPLLPPRLRPSLTSVPDRAGTPRLSQPAAMR